MSDDQIFVSVASYRDNQCQYTIQDLFRKAAHPERIVVGVCFQVAEEDEDSFLLDLSAFSDRIRTCFISHTEAKGPCYARALIHQELFRGEAYYFQIDSHLRFVQNWDEVCLKQLSRCESKKAILTGYASTYTLPKDYEPGEPDRAIVSTTNPVTILCADRFGDQNKDDVFLRIKTRNCRSNFDHIPPLSLFWTARFSFSRGAVVNEVPYDPHLEYIFFGEEIAMSGRLWTAGWDFFNPTETIAFHLGSRAHRQWFREVQTTPEAVQKEQAAKCRICGLLGHLWPERQRHPEPPAPYGLGTTRTLEQYERFAGVDFRGLSLEEHAKYGGISPDLFPPQWAEEERDRISQATQLQDTASWAGKDNPGAFERQFPQLASPPEPRAGPNPEAARARELTRVRIQSLMSQVHGQYGDASLEAELELSRSFAALGRIEVSDGDNKQAKVAYDCALQHAEACRGHAPSGREDDPAWSAAAAHSVCVAYIGLRRYDDAKGLFREALRLVTEAIEFHEDEASEQLAHDIVDSIHTAHEQTDDRKGLERFIRGFQALLKVLRKLSGAPPASVPVIAASEVPPEGESSVRARLLERIVLISIATGRDADTTIVRTVFAEFREARESPNMRRLLGMLQSSGVFLDL